MPYQTSLPATLKTFGLKVELVPGWETRGSSSFNPKGAVSHWTAGPRGSTTRPSLRICTYGRSDLPGPLCNVYLDRYGTAVVVAAGRANHAGIGGWQGLIGNSAVFGTEAECGGDGDWTSEQRIAYPRINAAYAYLGGFSSGAVCGHNEWAPTRKIDIRDWPMSHMRSQVSQILSNPTPAEKDVLMALTDAEQKQLLKDVELIKNKFVDPVINGGTLHTAVRELHRRLVNDKYDRLDDDPTNDVTFPSLVRYTEARVRGIEAKVDEILKLLQERSVE